MLVCPNCRTGAALRQRHDTKEWTHDIQLGTYYKHTICWANGFRNSRYKDELDG